MGHIKIEPTKIDKITNTNTMDYSQKTVKELITLCKEKKIKGYSGKKKAHLVKLLMNFTNNEINSQNTITKVPESMTATDAAIAVIVEATTETVREEGLDKFYTIPTISEKCLASISSWYEWHEWELVIEPSAGNGSFLTRIPTTKKIGIDISPEHEDIIKQDFLTYSPPSDISKILVVGNPPFGRVSSLAIKFFNHASKWAYTIAFIVPRTFRRVSVQNKLNANFHLIFDEEIPTEPCAFNPPMMVKCCFQIWEKQETKRTIIDLCITHNDWDFLGFGPKDEKGQPTPPEGADFAIRAYGGKCGDIVSTGLDKLRPKSWHWIKAKINKNTLIERFEALDYSLSLDTARQNSIGKRELVQLYSDLYN